MFARRAFFRYLALERLEDRITPTTFTDLGTTLIITLDNFANAIHVSSQGTAYTFTATDIINDGGVAHPGDFSGFGTNTVKMDVATNPGDYSAVDFVDTTFFQSVNFDDSGTNAYHHDFSVVLDSFSSGVEFSGASSFGTHSLSVTTDASVTIDPQTSVTSTDGDITMTANEQTPPLGGPSVGIDVNGGSITTTGTGSITLTARGGDNSSEELRVGAGTGAIGDNFGIEVHAQGKVQATGTGSVALTGDSFDPDTVPGIFLDGSGGAVKVSATTGNVSFTADAMSFTTNAAISGQAALFIQQRDSSRNIVLGGSADVVGALTLTSTDLAAIQPGFTSITIGTEAGSASLSTQGDATFTTTLSLIAPGGITVGNTIDTTGHPLLLSTTGSITGSGLLKGSDLTLTAGKGGIGSAATPLRIDGVEVSASVADTGIFLTDTAGGVSVGTIDAGSADVTLTAQGGGISAADPEDKVPDIAGNVITLVSAGVIGGQAGSFLEIDANTLNANTGGHDLRIAEIGVKGNAGLAIGLINAGGADVSLRVDNGGSLTSAAVDLVADIIGHLLTVTLTAGGSIGGGTASPLETRVFSVSADIQNGTGAIAIKDLHDGLVVILARTTNGDIGLQALKTGGLAVTTISAPGHAVTLHSDLGIAGSSATGAGITAQSLTMTATQAIGTLATPLQLSVGSFSADSASGGIVLSALTTATIAAPGIDSHGSVFVPKAGVFALGASNLIAATTTLNVMGGTVDIKTFSDTVRQLILTTGKVVGTTGVLTSTLRMAVRSGTASAILGGTAGLLQSSPSSIAILSGADTYTGITAATGPSLATPGTLDVRGTLAAGSTVVVGQGGQLRGTGTILGKVVGMAGGVTTPGTSVAGTLTVGNSAFLKGHFVAFNFDSASQTDVLKVNGTISVSKSTLNVHLGAGFTAPLGAKFTIIANDGTDPVVGTFINAPNGAVLKLNGLGFQIAYNVGGNDVTLTRVAALTAAGPLTHTAAAPLTAAALAPLVRQAMADWHRTAPVTVRIADLPGALLGLATSRSTIVIDPTAAGRGWFVDPTPASSSEFIRHGNTYVARAGTAAAGHMDLLTVLRHEIGHLNGLPDVNSSDALMAESLPVGVRKAV